MIKNIITLTVLILITITKTSADVSVMNKDQMEGDFNTSISPSINNSLPGEDEVLPTLDVSHGIVQDLANGAKELIKMAPHEANNEISQAINEQISAPKRDVNETSANKFLSAPKSSIVQTAKKILLSSYQGKTPEGMKNIPFQRSSSTVIFHRNIKYANAFVTNDYVSLPSGSSALVTLKAGLELSDSDVDQIIDARIDYAFLGPNGSVVELNGCTMWLVLNSRKLTERLVGRPTDISCRMPTSGRTFNIVVHTGVIIDSKDEYLGVRGKLLKRGAVQEFLVEFLQKSVAGFGSAIAASQITSTAVSGENSGVFSTQNVTGSKSKYATGTAMNEVAQSKFLNWWVNYYQDLSPTIAVKPGTKMFVTIKDELKIPKQFFGKISPKGNL